MRSRLGVLFGAVAALAGLVSVPAYADAADGYSDIRVDIAATPKLDWADCDGGFQCATASVPLDYDRPFGQKIDLALIRLRASDPSKRIGSLFVNFGGPGASGVDRLRQRAERTWIFSPELKARFDLVSWDPRGIARSAGVRCFPTEAEQQAFYAARPEMPGDPSGEAAFYADAKQLAAHCQTQAGEILKHASTANTARDLELLRRAVGDPKLTYHGISYGTQLGAIYANLFPGRIRAMAFDGSMDFVGNVSGHGDQGTTVPLDSRQDVPRGIADTFEYFLQQCKLAGPKCAFSAGDPRAKWEAIVAKAKQGPIVVDGTSYSYSAIVNAAGDLSIPSGYADTATLLQKLYDASSAPAARSAAVAGEPYLNNRDEAFNAIQCADSVFPRDPAVYSAAAVTEDQRVPYFGRIGVFDMMSCAFWQPTDDDRYVGPWNRKTSAPILVLNARFDPSTPLHGAYDGAKQLARAQVNVIEGSGHSTMFAISTCAEKLKREYLFTGVLPPASASCKVDAPPFG
ncbi:alpha/beta fold hydrolase [Amycolatopsis sp. NPDC059657]|uniref:alpha/beta fold hydrolase n=1 Tax=Amycolatopsis sp. NPDC059657 TaxID=3346899 RepID=UPI00366AEFFA